MTLHMKSKNLILSAILMAVSSTVMAQEYSEGFRCPQAKQGARGDLYESFHGKRPRHGVDGGNER